MQNQKENEYAVTVCHMHERYAVSRKTHYESETEHSQYRRIPIFQEASDNIGITLVGMPEGSAADDSGRS